MSAAKRPDGRHWLLSVRHPARRDGAIAVAFFLLPGVIALALEHCGHHLDGGAIAVLISVSFGMPLLWLTWALFRDSRRDAGGDGGLSLAEVAGQFAIAVGAQWEAEAAVRRLNDLYPMPVSWTAWTRSPKQSAGRRSPGSTKFSGQARTRWW